MDGQYALSSKTSTSAGKTIVHVKLTDSAYKALEEFQRIKVSISDNTANFYEPIGNIWFDNRDELGARPRLSSHFSH